MNNMFTESVKHAIQAMIYLAANKDENVMVSKIAEDYDIPKFYLAKLVQTLSKQGLIHTTRGRTGGIKLNKPAKEICVIDIIQAINGPFPDEAEEMCIFGLDICTDSVPCPIHDVWKGLKENIKGNLHHQNLESLAKELNRKHKISGSK